MSKSNAADCGEFFQSIYPSLLGTTKPTLSISSCCNKTVETFIECSTWSEVTRITKIVLVGQNLAGSIPTGISNLDALQTLKLTYNNLTGPIPKELGYMTKLQTLSLFGNNFTGKVPTTLYSNSFFNSFEFDYSNYNGSEKSDPFGNTFNDANQVFNTVTTVWKVIGFIIGSAVILSIFAFCYICINSSVTSSRRNNANRKNLKKARLNQPPILPQNINQNNQTIRPTIPSSIYNVKPTLNTYQNPPSSNATLNAAIPSQLSPDNIGVTITQTPPSQISSSALNNSTIGSTMYDMRLIILKKITGSGGVGNVYHATYDGKQAVAKIPFEKEHERLVYEESRLMTKLRCPYIVQSLAFISDALIDIPDQPPSLRTALIIEYMNLGSLSTYITPQPLLNKQKEHRLVNNNTLQIAIQAAKGIQFMHQNGYAHLDLKPDNILLHQENESTIVAKISDLGSAKENGSTDNVFQTKGYIPPEAAHTAKKSFGFDIYAFGCILVNILTKSNVNVWWGFGKSWQEKNEYLQTYIPNTQVFQLISDCLKDSPVDRPTIDEIINRLNSFNQSDFQSTQIRLNTSSSNF
ncbi:kinase-like domain-containing protein [Globomyces pollinis-pini]|nr:kinase-like domain-containing protein [Globomyces pollinis-pini]